MLDFNRAPRQGNENSPDPSGPAVPCQPYGDPASLYHAPFDPTVRNVIFFRDEATADIFSAKLSESTDTRATCMPEGGKWSEQFTRQLLHARFTGFFGSDDDFLCFANGAAKSLYNARFRDAAGKIMGHRVVKIVECPPNFDVIASDIQRVVHLFRQAPDYRPPSDADGGGQDEPDDEAEGDEKNRQGSNRSEKIKAIQAFRIKRTKLGKNPPNLTDKTGKKSVKRTFVEYWWYAGVLRSKLPNGELAAACLIKSCLMGPWAFECWMGSGKAAEWSKMSKPTWLRNRDGLAGKGLIELEDFGNGSAPIIYIIAPDISFRSVFAPSYRSARKKKEGNE